MKNTRDTMEFSFFLEGISKSVDKAQFRQNSKLILSLSCVGRNWCCFLFKIVS